MDSNYRYNDIPLTLIQPNWNSPLASLVLELERLRHKKVGGKVHPLVFIQLKEIFQTLESLASVRIEGNNTTISEVVEAKIEGKKTKDEGFKEIENIERGMEFLEAQIIAEGPMSKALLLELHKIIVKDLTPPPEGEGSKSPGKYRDHQVKINKSKLAPPNFLVVEEKIKELVEFVNNNNLHQNDLLIIAIAHHRLAWIHAFDNGNGRLVRLFTYGLLMKYGFNVSSYRIINPAAIFHLDRDKYYDMLARADSGGDHGLEEWCEYMLKGLLEEIKKIDKLLDKDYLVKNILEPAFEDSLKRKFILPEEYNLLIKASQSKNMTIKASDLGPVESKSDAVMRSKKITALRKKGMLMPIRPGARIYVPYFTNNYLFRSIIEMLKKEKFVNSKLDKKNL